MSDSEPVYAGILVTDTAGDEELARLLQTQEEGVIARPVDPGYGRRMQSKSKRGKRPQRAVEIADDGNFRDTFPAVGSQPGYTPGVPNRTNTTSDYYYQAWRPRDSEMIVRSDESFDTFFLCLFCFCWVVILVILLVIIWLSYT